MPASIRAQLRRGLVSGLRMAVVIVVLGVAALFLLQDRLIWHPRPYARGEVKNFPLPLEALVFHTAQGSQTVFYAPPRDRPGLPAALWVLFAGNGSLALDWGDIIRGDTSPGYAFLFIDYPGYGRCEGQPSPASIRENTAGAMDALARRLGQPDGAALARALVTSGGQMGVMGHSIGTGTALEFAARRPEVTRVVLVSPFTGLRAMARTVVGWPLGWLLRGNFDNRARLDELAARPVPPRVFIFHGDADTLVPQAMGRALAAAHPSCTRFESVAGGDHGDTAYLARASILNVLNQTEGGR